MEGGYQIIDLKNKPLKGTPVDFPGIYELVEGTRKPLLIQNIVKDNGDGTTTEYRDFIGSARITGSQFRISDYSQGITIIVALSITNNSIAAIATPNVSAGTGTEEITTLLVINDTLEFDENGALGVASE